MLVYREVICLFLSNNYTKAGQFVGEMPFLCGCSVSRQCDFFIGCKPHCRISHIVCKTNLTFILSSATVALLEEDLLQKHEVVGLIPTLERVFSHVCAHFCMCGRNRLILSRFRREGNSNAAQPYIIKIISEQSL